MSSGVGLVFLAPPAMFSPWLRPPKYWSFPLVWLQWERCQPVLGSSGHSSLPSAPALQTLPEGQQAQPPKGCSPRALKLWHSGVPVGCPPPRPAAGAFVSHVPPWERGCGFALSGGQLSTSECLGRKGCGGQRVRDPPSLRSLSPNSLAPPPANVFSSGPGCGVGCRCVPIIRCGK